MLNVLLRQIKLAPLVDFYVRGNVHQQARCEACVQKIESALGPTLCFACQDDDDVGWSGLVHNEETTGIRKRGNSKDNSQNGR
jgi:hypothetical protein